MISDRNHSAIPSVTIKGHHFRPYLTATQIAERVAALGRQIGDDYPHNPVLVCILKGGFMFAADLTRAIPVPHAIDFMQIRSYDGLGSTGQLTLHLDLATPITGRDVIIVEDIIDTGRTITGLLKYLRQRQPASLSIATLLHKPDATLHPLDLPYIGFTIPNKFVIGYGLDYDEQGRHLPHIYMLNE